LDRRRHVFDADRYEREAADNRQADGQLDHRGPARANAA